MQIKQLAIRNFRNIEQMDFRPAPGANIIYGDNAQGKTNLLEAIWLFSGAKSFRGSKESEYIRFSQDHAGLDILFTAEGRNQSASVIWGKDMRKVKLNEIKQDRLSSLAGVFCSVVFSPDHLLLVKQGPEKRRKMIDTALCQAYPKYGKILDSYNKSLKQRNILLKDIPRNSILLETLDIWDNNLIEYGSYITAMRARYIRKLTSFAEEFYRGISFGKEQFGLQYIPGTGKRIESQADLSEIKQLMKAQLHKSRGDDIRNGISSTGPHRDDLEITIEGKSARSFGSQGQQRSCILALKLAECGILEERNGEPPVIMLDDVMSELDEHRRGYLLNQLTGKQVLITCCDARDFTNLKHGGVFRMQEGTIIA